MSRNEFSLLNEIQTRRNFVTEVSAIAIGLALFINLFSSDISPYLNSIHPALKFAFLFMLYAVSMGGIFSYIYSKTTEETEFNILLPIVVKTEEVKIEKIKGYSPPYRANQLISPLRDNHEFKNGFIQDFMTKTASGDLSEAGVFKDTMLDVSSALIMSLIKLFGEHSLSTATLYHKEYRHLAWKFKSKSIKIEELPELLKSNPFLKIESLKLPEKVHLSSKLTKENTLSIYIDSPYCWIEFNILSYLRLISKDNDRKTTKVVIKSIGRDDAVILSIPLQITIGIKRFKILSKKTDDYYLWMRGLMTDALKWLSWEEYEKGDWERLIVDINQDVAAIKKQLEGNQA